MRNLKENKTFLYRCTSPLFKRAVSTLKFTGVLKFKGRNHKTSKYTTLCNTFVFNANEGNGKESPVIFV